MSERSRLAVAVDWLLEADLATPGFCVLTEGGERIVRHHVGAFEGRLDVFSTEARACRVVEALRWRCPVLPCVVVPVGPRIADYPHNAWRHLYDFGKRR